MDRPPRPKLSRAEMWYINSTIPHEEIVKNSQKRWAKRIKNWDKLLVCKKVQRWFKTMQFEIELDKSNGRFRKVDEEHWAKIKAMLVACDAMVMEWVHDFFKEYIPKSYALKVHLRVPKVNCRYYKRVQQKGLYEERELEENDSRV